MVAARNQPPRRAVRGGATVSGGIRLALVESPNPEAMRRAVAHLGPSLPLLTELGQLFAAAGHELALVGGPVRDAFLGRTAIDLDFTTSARPAEIEALLTPWADTTWDIGRDFGTIGGIRGQTSVEITTYRADAYRTAEAGVVRGSPADKLRVLRGGGCCSIFGLPRAADRLALPLDYRDADIGFRCAKDIAPSDKRAP